jgi:hypothetical protein
MTEVGRTPMTRCDFVINVLHYAIHSLTRLFSVTLSHRNVSISLVPRLYILPDVSVSGLLRLFVSVLSLFLLVRSILKAESPVGGIY